MGLLKPGPVPGCEKRVPEVCPLNGDPRKGPWSVKDMHHLAGRKSVLLAVDLILAPNLPLPPRTDN